MRTTTPGEAGIANDSTNLGGPIPIHLGRHNLMPLRSASGWRRVSNHWEIVTGALFAVVVILISSSVPANMHGIAGVAAQGGTLAPLNDSTLSLALANASLFPAPSALSGLGGNVSLPKLVTLNFGTDGMEGLLFVVTDPLHQHYLEFQTGQYSPNMAQLELLGTGCPSSCPPTIPIRWNAPVVINDFGTAPVQSDSIAVSGSEIAVAASSNGQTWAWLGAQSYSTGAWDLLSNPQFRLPITGSDGRIAVSGCTAALSALNGTTAWLTTFNLTCPWAISNPDPGYHLPGARPLVTGPTVTEVSPDCGPYGTAVTISGTNFAGGATAEFGANEPFVATTFVSPSTLTVNSPKSGMTGDVIVQSSGLRSPSNPPSDLYTYSNVSSQQPCVWSLTPTSGAVGATVNIRGYDFQPSSIVLVGGTPAPAIYLNSGNLSITLPVLCPGSFSVTVQNGPLVSPIWAGSTITVTQTTPTITSVSPTSGSSGTVVTINGNAIGCYSPTVKFGSTSGTGVTIKSYTQLKATAPAGSGTVDITATVNGLTTLTNAHDQFSYSGSSTPTVTALNVSAGHSGTAVKITGTNFDKWASVSFGSLSATNVVFVSGTTLTAVAPFTYGIVNVTVTVNQLTSSTNSADLFAYPSPAVGQVYPAYGVQGSIVLVSGSYLAPGARIWFNQVLVTSEKWISSSGIDVTVPRGGGTEYVTVVENGTQSVNNTPQDEFTYGSSPPYLGPSLQFVRNSYRLAPASDAVPILLAGEPLPFSARVLLSNPTVGQIQFYNYTTAHHLDIFVDDVPSSFQASLGNPLFGSIGATSTGLASSAGGQVEIVANGPILFIAFTTIVGDESAVETAISTDTGLSWHPTYTALPSLGALSNPSLTGSPEGPYFATWQDDGSGGSEVDMAVFSDSGHLAVNSTVIRGSGGASVNASTPTITVDEWERPLLAWNSSGGPSAPPSLLLTGGYLSPSSIASWMQSGFRNLTASDFIPVVNLIPWRATQNASLTQLSLLLGAQQWCPAEAVFFDYVYANITSNYGFPFYNATPTLCVPNPTIQYHATNLYPAIGASSPGEILSVEEEWMVEALGYGVSSPPSWLGSPGNAVNFTSLAAGLKLHPARSGSVIDKAGDYFAINPVAINPNTVILNATGAFETNETFTSATCNGGAGTTTSTIVDSPANYSTYVQESLNSTVHGHGTGGYPYAAAFVGKSPVLASVYLVNLNPLGWGNWSESIAASYQAVFTYKNSCIGNETNQTIKIPRGMPSFTNLTTHGTWSTQLGFLPTAPPLLVSRPVPGNNNQMVTTARWNNTMWATANVTTNQTSGTGHTIAKQSLVGYNITENITLRNVNLSAGLKYNDSFDLLSLTGGTSSAWTPQLNGNEPGQGARPLTSVAYCSYNMSVNPVALYWDKNYITNITNTSVDLTWYASGMGVGMAIYNESWGPAEEETASSTAIAPYHGMNFRYTAELHDLIPWGTYSVEILQLTQDGGCHVFMNSAMWGFNTTRTFYIWEQDLPYDSINRVGGGALVTYQVPLALLDATGVTFKNGDLQIVNLSRTTDFANYNLLSTPVPIAPGLFSVNVSSGLNGSTTYGARMWLNFSYGPTTLPGWSRQIQFVYHRSTSGDGLTDWEKVQGWAVTTRGLDGTYHTRSVSADPSDWATNGLVNDFVEKEFALDPTTVDSAGSDMLDTWNLTFDLGSNASNPALPAGAYFETWNALGFYTWTSTCQVFAVNGCPSGYSFTPIHSGWSNVSDSAPWSSEVLWSRTALTRFINMSGVLNAGWLRAVLGTANGERTLTVWGKLSWGANPLAASTPGSSIPDGARVNPTGSTDLQVTINSWSSSWSDSGNSLQSGNSISAFVDTSSTSAPYFPNGASEYANYTKQYNVTSGSSESYPGSFVVTFPVVPTLQSTNLNVTLVADIGVNGATTLATVLSTPIITPDLFTSNLVTKGYSNGSANSLSLSWQPVTLTAKAPTLLLLPANNTSVSNLPAGLMRYTGDQDFVLLELNDTLHGSNSNLLASGINFPNSASATYSVTLQSGLTNLLVPRALFLDSPLGQAILNGTNVTVNWTGSNSILQSSFYSQEWYARGTGNSWTAPNQTVYNYAKGKNPGFIPILSSTTQSCTPSTGMCGSVPAAPGLTSGNQGLAVGAILTINLNTSGDLYGLLGGLLLNGPGNFVGWTLSATTLLPTLGLQTNVLSALANYAVRNDGAFGVPISSTVIVQVQAQPWWAVAATAIWNAASGVLSAVAGYVGALISAVWSGILAAAAFLGDLASNAYRWGLGALNQAAKYLEQVAAAILAAIEALIAAIVKAAEKFFTGIWNDVLSLANAYVQGVHTAFVGFMSAVYSAANASGGNPTLNAAAATAGLVFMSSLVGMQSVVGGLVSGLQTVMSDVQPILQYISLSWLMAQIESAIGSVNPLGGALGFVNAAMNTVTSTAASLFDAALNYSGAQVTINNPQNVPPWLPLGSTMTTFMSGGAGLGISFQTWLKDAASYIDPSSVIAVLVTTAIATAAYGIYLYDEYVPAKQSEDSNFAVAEGEAILLTIAGWVFLAVNTVWSDEVSLMFDTWSSYVNLKEDLSGEVNTGPEIAVSLADWAADILDGGVCLYNLKQSNALN